MALAGLALVVITWGIDGARTLAFPFGFLLLAVPLPPSVLEQLSALAQSLADYFHRIPRGAPRRARRNV